jgi:hypothetical protein
MHRLLTALRRGFKERIGWKRLGIAASLLIIALAITTLVHTLKGVDGGVILVALTEKSPGQIALAALCVIGAFCTLTFYDFFALRTIGKVHVPYRIAALSSFTSYSIGHNIGATVFTGGAIRFRIYSDYGLNAIDVAKICFISGLTFWLGNAFVLGLGLAWHPQAASAMDLLPPAVNRLIAMGCLAGIAIYFTWLSMGESRRELGQNGWKVVLPSWRLTLLQILIGLRQSRAGKPGRVRRRDAGGAAAIRQGANGGDAGGVQDPVFRDPVQHCYHHHGNPRNLAQRRAAVARAPQGKRDRRRPGRFAATGETPEDAGLRVGAAIGSKDGSSEADR